MPMKSGGKPNAAESDTSMNAVPRRDMFPAGIRMALEEKSNNPVAVEREDRVVRIALNEPDNRNRLTPRLCRALLDAIGEAAASPGCGCLLLEQCGDVFCAGLDFDSLANPETGPQFAQQLERLFRSGAELRKPVVAAVHGACAGAGVGLLLECHYVLAAQGTKFAIPDIHSALWPAAFYPLLEQAAGRRRARELALTGRVFSAADALSWGLVDELAPAFELEERAMQMASALASLSPAAVAAGLAFASGERGAEGVAGWLATQAAAPDVGEALAAARERRRPQWPSSSSCA